jgi:hypothetical protein
MLPNHAAIPGAQSLTTLRIGTSKVGTNSGNLP